MLLTACQIALAFPADQCECLPIHSCKIRLLRSEAGKAGPRWPAERDDLLLVESAGSFGLAEQSGGEIAVGERNQRYARGFGNRRRLARPGPLIFELLEFLEGSFPVRVEPNLLAVQLHIEAVVCGFPERLPLPRLFSLVTHEQLR